MKRAAVDGEKKDDCDQDYSSATFWNDAFVGECTDTKDRASGKNKESGVFGSAKAYLRTIVRKSSFLGALRAFLRFSEKTIGLFGVIRGVLGEKNF